MDNKKQKFKKDEFDLLVGKIKKNKKLNNSENLSNTQNILGPIVKSSSINIKKLDIDDSTNSDSTTDDSDNNIDDTTTSDSTSNDDKKRREKKKQKDKEKIKKNKDKVKSKEIKEKKSKRSKKQEKNEYKNTVINQSQKLVNPAKMKNNFRNRSRNFNNNNNNPVFVDPSTVTFTPIVNVPAETKLEEVKNFTVNSDLPLESNQINTTDVNNTVIERFINLDYNIHNSDNISIENSINIVDVKDDKIEICTVNMPSNVANGTFIELINISQYIKLYEIKSNYNIKRSQKIEDNLYQLSSLQNIKFIFHNDEWISIF